MTRSSLLALAAALAFAVAIVASARRLRTDERHTLVWLLVCAAIAGLAIWRHAIDVLAAAMGIYYAPSALFFLCCGALLWLVFRQSLEVARQREQIRRLAQEVALLAAQVTPDGAAGRSDAGPAASREG
ncbi:MAG TPA: DUF2304 domain-containing protein [Myxococcales bacterium]|nr:DUF2304 domain-containing protein [Myxococcales bacterium]